MSRLVWLAAACVAALSAGSAQAGTLDRIRAAGVVRCGAAARAGFADAGEGGRVKGLAVDLCRALTMAVLGPQGRTDFRIYNVPADYDSVRQGADDVAFLTADEVVAHGLAAAVIPGPTVFVAELTVLAQPGVDALAGRTVCFMNGSPAQQALEAWAAHTATSILRSGYQEDGELHDAFDAKRCDAIAGEATELAEIRAGTPSRSPSTILPPLAVMPVMAASPVGDGAWAGLAGWALAAVVQTEASPSPWRSDPPGAVIAGLKAGWLQQVSATLGSYVDMTRRAFGAQSDLRLPPGPNAPWPAGLLLPPGPR